MILFRSAGQDVSSLELNFHTQTFSMRQRTYKAVQALDFISMSMATLKANKNYMNFSKLCAIQLMLIFGSCAVEKPNRR